MIALILQRRMGYSDLTYFAKVHPVTNRVVDLKKKVLECYGIFYWFLCNTTCNYNSIEFYADIWLCMKQLEERDCLGHTRKI